MKKIISVLLTALMIFMLCACGGGGTKTDDLQNCFVFSDYLVEYNSFEIVEDSYGDPVIALNYTYTNNSDEACSFFVASMYEAEQAGEALSLTTVYVNEYTFEAMDDMIFEDVAPGESLDIVLTYGLIDTTSPVTVTFEELFGDHEDSHVVEIDGYVQEDEEENDEYDNDIYEAVDGESEFLNSEWYGWWIITDATGDYESYDGEYFDCCAVFEKTNEGYILMSIWDETYPDYEDECLGEVFFEEIDGMLVSAEGGFFYTGEAVGEGQMIIDPAFSEYEHTLFTYANIEDEAGSFVASINLTEWGYEWDEGFNDFPTYYDSYFLPLMEEGEALPANLDDIG